MERENIFVFSQNVYHIFLNLGLLTLRINLRRSKYFKKMKPDFAWEVEEVNFDQKTYQKFCLRLEGWSHDRSWMLYSLEELNFIPEVFLDPTGSLWSAFSRVAVFWSSSQLRKKQVSPPPHSHFQPPSPHFWAGCHFSSPPHRHWGHRGFRGSGGPPPPSSPPSPH